MNIMKGMELEARMRQRENIMLMWLTKNVKNLRTGWVQFTIWLTGISNISWEILIIFGFWLKACIKNDNSVKCDI